MDPNMGFHKKVPYYFCMMIEGSGSGFRRPKNMWVRWIQIRIRIRNTAFQSLIRDVKKIENPFTVKINAFEDELT
jgi:hypothetical protein